MQSKETTEKTENTFSKEEILRSSQFTGVQKDMLANLLKDNKDYTLTKCRDLLKKEEGRVIK